MAALIYHQHFIQGPEISETLHKIETREKEHKKKSEKGDVGVADIEQM